MILLIKALLHSECPAHPPPTPVPPSCNKQLVSTPPTFPLSLPPFELVLKSAASHLSRPVGFFFFFFGEGSSASPSGFFVFRACVCVFGQSAKRV